MSDVIAAIYEGGVFKPLQPIQLPEHWPVRLLLVTDEEESIVQAQKQAAQKIMGLGHSGQTTVARQHDD